MSLRIVLAPISMEAKHHLAEVLKPGGQHRSGAARFGRPCTSPYSSSICTQAFSWEEFEKFLSHSPNESSLCQVKWPDM